MAHIHRIVGSWAVTGGSCSGLGGLGSSVGQHSIFTHNGAGSRGDSPVSEPGKEMVEGQDPCTQ